MGNRLSLVLPCYNEAQAIPPVLTKLLRCKDQILSETGLESLEIIVVNDGSTDDSKEQLVPFLNSISVLEHTKCQGYGRALKTGFQAGQGDLLGFYDLDDTCQPLDLIPMVNAIKSEKADLVCGNRLGANSDMPLTRRIGNTFYQQLTQLLLKKPVEDCCSGYRVFRASYKKQFIDLLPENLNFSLAMTVSFLRREDKYLEIPIRYKDRIGPSKLSVFSDGPRFLLTLLYYCWSPKFSKKRLMRLAQ